MSNMTKDFKVVDNLTITDDVLTITNVFEDEYPAWDETIIYAVEDRVIYVDTDVHKVYESKTGKRSVVTITIANPGVVSWAGHGLAANTPIMFTTTDTLPTNIDEYEIYYVRSPSTDTFTLSATPGGAAIATSGSQAGVHTATAGTNLNINPYTDADTATHWAEVGATNAWKMFDLRNSSQTINADAIDVELTTTGRNNTIYLGNISAAEVTIVGTDSVYGEFYNETHSLVLDTGPASYYSFFFGTIRRKRDFLLENLTPYLDATYNITLSDPGADVKCGTCIIGKAVPIGSAQYGSDFGIQDFSRKVQNEFGDYEITERAFSNNGNFSVIVDNESIDQVRYLLSDRRATASLYIATSKYSSTWFFGMCEDWRTVIQYPTQSLLSVKLQGLT